LAAAKLLPLLKALQDLLADLVEAETPTPRPTPPPTPPPGHAAHLVVSRFGGMDMCCEPHTAEFEANVRRYGEPQRTVNVLAGPAQRYIEERLGNHQAPLPKHLWR
jgi:hypothetical protein